MIQVEETMPLKKRKTITLVVALANKIINELNFVNTINASLTWDETQWGISPGQLLKALVLSTFTDMRAPLTHLQNRLSGMDLEHLIGYEATTNDINAFNVGRALGRLGKTDVTGTYEAMALTALQKYNIQTTRIHNDTTSISFHGEYDISSLKLTEEEEQEILRIEKGYNKDGRPGDCQIVVGQMVNQLGIPLTSKAMDGSTSDIEWNKLSLDYLDRLMNTGFSYGVYVADCKLVIEELVRRMNNPEGKISFVSRCPANFNETLEKRVTAQAYSADAWEDLGQLGSGKNASQYRGTAFIKSVFGSPMRLLVLESSSLLEKAEKSLEKAKNALLPLVKALEKKTFACHADAEKEYIRFLERKELKLFNCEADIEKVIKEKWPPGCRGTNTHPKLVETYHVRIRQMEFDEERRTHHINNESTFVLISNITDESISNKDLLATYKGQHIVETSFRQLKEPNLASVIYLKNPTRVKALTMLLTFSLLIRALIQYRMREGLMQHNTENPNVPIYAGWGGKPLNNPTYKLLYEHSINCKYERNNSGGFTFAWPDVETKDEVSSLLALMGLNPTSILQ